MEVTRRTLARALAAAAIADVVVDVEAPAQSPGDLLKAARDEQKANALRLAQVKVPPAVEPPFHFKP